MGKLSQRSFNVINNSDTTVCFSIRAQPSPAAEMEAITSALAAVQHRSQPWVTAVGAKSSTGSWQPGASSQAGILRSSSALQRQQQQQQRLDPADYQMDVGGYNSSEGAMAAGHQQQQNQRTSTADLDSSAQEDVSLLGDEELATLRQIKRARRDIAADNQLFGTPHFAVFPPEGSVCPHSEQEVIVQFSPDAAQDFEAVAWVELQGAGDRLPLHIKGQGLGAQVIFSYDLLDIGDAFVNTEHQYEVELLNRGKIEAHWMLQPCHTRFGSKFSFTPEAGVLQPAGSQTVHVKLLSDSMGRFEETFQLHLKGSQNPLNLSIKGAVVGPQFSLDVQGLDYGTVSYSFRYSQGITISNTGAIPLSYSWHVLEDADPAAGEFSIMPAKGTVLPYAKQKVQVDFQPQTVQRYALNLVMDIPDVANQAAVLPIKAECAVPLISLAEGGGVLAFGQVYLRHPYTQLFTLVNESKLPAKYEVVLQVRQDVCKNLVSEACLAVSCCSHSAAHHSACQAINSAVICSLGSVVTSDHKDRMVASTTDGCST
eukprot:GHRR01013859.1.p1 GENE.GHRR01013859.1~~GHRR01013859.1.p1  ORF type:complete len:540 (+),score=183.59 GHRR01013859.1:1141-2760(+)